MSQNFCPFINGNCRPDCVFRSDNTIKHLATNLDVITNCMLASKISFINEVQCDQLNEIIGK